MRIVVLAAVVAGVALAGEHISKGRVRLNNEQDTRQPPSRAGVRKGEVETNFGGTVPRANGKGERKPARPATMSSSNGNADFEAGSNKQGSVVAAKGSNRAQSNFKGSKGQKKYDVERERTAKGTADVNLAPANGKGEQKMEWKGVGKGRDSTYEMSNNRKSAKGDWDHDNGPDEGTGTFVGAKGLQTKIEAGQDAEENNIEMKGAKKNNGQYIATVDNDERRDESEVTIKSSGQQLGRSHLDAGCNGRNVGLSGCQNGNKKSPSVRKADRTNEAAVVTANNRELANVNVAKTGNRRTGPVYNAHINPASPRSQRQRTRGRARANSRTTAKLYLGSASGFKQRDCYRDIIKNKNDPNPNDIRVVNDSMKMVYNFEEENGKSVYTFPDCFKISVDVVLGKDVRVKDLAYEVQARISPVGDLLCADPGVCGKGACYYCDLCDRDRERLQITSNVDRSQACDKAGPQRVTLSTTVCPPPEDYEYAQCAAISNPYASDFWRKNDEAAIVVRFLVWSRPKDIDDMRKNFFYRKEKEPGFIDGLKTSYTASLLKKGKLERLSLGSTGANGLPQVEASDYVLLHYYLTDGIILRPDEYKEQLLMCEAGETDYDVGGSKAGANVLVEAASKIKSGDKVEDNAFQAKCPAVESIHEEQVKELERDWAASGKPEGKNPSNNPLSAISGIFGGRNTNSGSTGRTNPFANLFGG